VVGLGPGGEDLAGRLAEAGLHVVAIDAELVGGECPYWGCVPSKMMIRAANLLAEGRRIEGMAGTATVSADWAPVAERIRKEATDTWDDTAAVDRLTGRGARFVRGWAHLDGPGRVVVDGQAFEATKAVVLNTGARSWAPPIPGLEGTPYWTNRQAIEAEEVPGSMIILGGGPIGLELGQVFSRFGAEVTVVEVADRLLAVEDPESSELIQSVFTEEGIEVITGASISRVAYGDGFTVSIEGRPDVSAPVLLVATGRRPDLEGLRVGTVGLDEGARSIPVDEHLRAGPGLWAIGDVTGIGPFTHVSMYQSAIAVSDILGQAHATADYRALPRVTFTDPEIGSVGLGEHEARERGIRVGVGTTQVPSTTRGWIHKAGNAGFIKLIADLDNEVLVGATSAGPIGGEVLGLLTLAIHARVPLSSLRSMIYAYPTFHRGVEAALADISD
jgi:pyruvate/2-oxoglutarate dehydrogenase complex dihydrolipoamide dehydrogenase (E3) component